jgi:hypothetical protein
MQGADRFRGIARPAAGKMQPVPILDQHPERQPVARAPRPLGFRGFLAHCRRVQAFATSPMMVRS